MFNLQRYFSIASLSVIVVVTFFLSVFYKQLAENSLMELTENQSIMLTHHLLSEIHPIYDELITTVFDSRTSESRIQSEIAQFKERMDSELKDLSVLKIKIYSKAGLTVYSTDTSEIGENKSSHPGFLEAISGQTASSIIYRGDIYHGRPFDRDVQASYIPMQLNGSERAIDGIFEVYTDVTASVEAIKNIQRRIVAGAISALGSLYLVLFLIVRHADKTIKRQETERRQAETAIRESEARLSGILDIASEAIISIDEAQRIILFNKGAEKIFGYTGNEVLGQPLDILLPKRFQKVHQNHIVEFNNSGIRAKPMLGRQDISGIRKNGEEFPAEASISKLELSGKMIFTAVLRDITERRNKDKKITESVREKEVLLKEVHHRVKNNLQIISSLLNLQADHVLDPHAREVFKESQNRIRSMALIHEKLYQSQDMSKVDLAKYIENLMSHLFHSYNVNSNQVTLKTHVSNIFLPIDTVIPCGLIINELVTNSLKYAFPEKRQGEVYIDVRPDSHDQLLIRVGDNGIGLNQNLDMRNTKTLGMQLVFTLTAQLGGTVKVENNGGAVFTITFPGPHPKGTYDHG